MQHRTLTLLVCLALGIYCASRVAADEPPAKSELELYAFLTRIDDKLLLNLRITNLTDKPNTVLTKQPSFLAGFGTNGKPAPYIGIGYWILGTSSPGSRSWKFIPSLPDLAPVRLLKDGTATMTIPLDPESAAAALKDPDVIFTIEYEIREDIAERFDLWHGKLSLKESVKSLLKK